MQAYTTLNAQIAVIIEMTTMGFESYLYLNTVAALHYVMLRVCVYYSSAKCLCLTTTLRLTTTVQL